MKDKIYIKNKGYVDIVYKKQDIKSTHIDKPQRDYEIWTDCQIDGKQTNQRFFVIKKYSPWVDSEVLSNSESLMDYTQGFNKIIETFKITKEMVVTSFYDWHPSVIKSANNFYSKDTFLERGKKHLDFFSSKINSDRFYRSVIDEYRKQIVRAIEYMLHNIGISEKKLHNSAMLASGAASGALPVGGVAPPSTPPLHLMGKEATSLLSSNPMGLRVK